MYDGGEGRPLIFSIADKLVIMPKNIPIPKPMMITCQCVEIASKRGILISNVMLRPISINGINRSKTKEKLKR